LGIPNPLFRDANIGGVQVNPDVVHPSPDRSHTRRTAAHERVDDGIAGLGNQFEQVRQQGYRLDAVVEVPAHLLRLVEGRFALARLLVHRAQRQGISAQFALPVGRLVVGKDGRGHLAIAKGVLRAQPARAPLGNILGVGLTVGLLASHNDGLVSGPKPRVHFGAQRLDRWHAVRVVPDPAVADFKASGFQISGEDMRQVRKAEHSDMRAGL
jgi:hypothetical protein